MEKRELSVDEVKKIEISILDFVTDIAKRNGIKCFLDGGTLLGAVRHKGFIPWDDDIDVIVPRKDYKRLLDCIKKEQSRFRILSMYDSSDYFYPFAKAVDSTTIIEEYDIPPINGYGVYIDLFPLDNIPDDRKAKKLFYKKIERYRWICSRALRKQMDNYPKTMRNRLVMSYAGLIGWKRAIIKIDRLCENTAFMSSDIARDIVAARITQKEAPSKCFNDTVELEFEGKKYSAPVGYDVYLKALYGDYMKLPPEDQRVSNHHFKAWQIIGDE